MDNWKIFLTDWEDLSQELKVDIYSTNSGYWSNKIVEILGDLFNEDNFDDAISFILKFYEIESNLEYIDKIIKAKIICKGIVDFASEIQKTFLEYEEKLVELCKKILIMNFHPFFKFLYSNQEINNNLEKNESCIEILYSSMQCLNSMAKDLKAQEEFGKLYSNQWHFFFELLQNAVDAESEKVLVKRKLIENELCLLFANKGKKFSPMDVWGIASIKQGMKSSKNIGYFGIGFKSVQEICDSPIIISQPFQFRLNLGKRNRPYYVEWNLSEAYSKAFSLEQLRYKNYFILDEIKKEEYSGFEEKVIDKIDPMFMMFLTPLKEIIFSFEGLEDKLLNVKRKSLGNGFEIIDIDDNKEKFIINRYSKKFIIENKEFERQVQIAFKINEKSKKIIVEHKNSNLFSYFPLDNRNPGFNFVFQGQFSLTSSRQDINTAISLQTKLNYTLFEELGPKCFLELFKFLSSSKNIILDEKLESLIPFEEKAMVIESDPNYLDIDIYNSFRGGLTKLLKDTDNQQIPFWWDQKKSYIPFSNVIFTDDSSENSNNLIIKFIKEHFKPQFIDEITEILQNSSIRIDPEKEIYICNDKFKIDFCKEVFDNEFHDRYFTSKKILDLIINILRSFDSTIDVDYILKRNWKKNYYFKSEQELEEFQELLLKWHFFEEESTKARIFEHYLILLEDCDANAYYAKVSFSNYYILEEIFQKAYPEVISVIRQLNVWSERNTDYDLDLPLFIPEKYKRSSNNFYSKENFYSIFKLNKLLYFELDENLNLLILSEEVIYRSFFKIIAKAIKRIEQKSSKHKNKFKLSELRKEYRLITGNPEIYGESNLKDEALIIRIVLQNFLELSIYKRITSNELLPFSEIIWGDENYINLLSISQFADSYNLLDLPFYNNFMKMQLFQENLVNLMNLIKIFDDNKEYFSRYFCNWFSNDTITEALDNLIKEHSGFILHKEPQDLIQILLDLETENQIVKILFSFLSSNEIFVRFSEIFYSSIDILPSTLIFLSDLTDPSLYQFYYNKGDELTIEVTEKLQSDLFIPIIELYSLDEKENNWICRTDLNNLTNIGIRDISIKKSISDLLIDILSYLKSSEGHENWYKFYILLESHYSNLKEKSRTKFRQEFKTKLEDFKILNEENELITLNQVYNNDNFFKSFKEFSYISRNLIDLPYFESNKVHSDYSEIWDFLVSANLFPSPNISMRKEFMKKLLGKVFQESMNEELFYNFLKDNISEEQGENYIGLYNKLLDLIKSVRLKLKEIKDFHIIPTMTMEFIKVKDVKEKYNILINFDLEDFPREEILENFEEFNCYLFDDWLHPGYFGSFKKVYKKDIEKKVAYNGKRFDEDIRTDVLLDDFLLEENSPFFLHLYLIEYYFRRKEFNFEEDKKIISNSLKIFTKNNINSFLSKLQQNNIPKKDIQTIFSQAISKRRIFPVHQGESDEIYLTDLDSKDITILSKKFVYPRMFIEISEEHKVISYINGEIEKIIEKIPKELNLSLKSYVFPLNKILEKCENIFCPKVEEDPVNSDHVQLIKYVFNKQNFNYYLQNDRENLDNFLSSIELKTLSNEPANINEIFNPKLIERVEEGLEDLIGSNFKREKLKSKKILDLSFYGLEENFVKITFDEEIFKDEISRKEAYEILLNYLNENLQESENYREILKQIGGNLINFDNSLKFPEEKSLEILEDSIKQIIQFFINKIIEHKEIDFGKFFLDTEQEYYRDLLSKDLIITTEHRDVDLLDNFAEYLEIEEDSKFSFFKDLMPFKEIEDYSFDILINQIQKKDCKRIIKALDILFEEYADSLEPQKETEEYKKIKDDLLWIQITGEYYCLKSLFLQNSDLDISSKDLGFVMKGYAFFDDFDVDDQNFDNFIEFFDIREISDEDIIDHLEYLSSLAKNVKTNIRELLSFIIEKEFLKINIDRIKKIKFIEAVDLSDNYSKKKLSLETLLGTYTFFSNKKLIIDNLVNEWSKTPEFQDSDIYLLFDKDVTWSTKWEDIIENILIALKFEKLYGIDEFPIPDSIDESDMTLGDNPYEKQTKILRAIFEYIKINIQEGFPSLNLKEARLDFLEKPIKFNEIVNPRGNITIKTIDNYDFAINNVYLKKMFKMEEKDDIINVYISTDHRPSDRKKLYFREIYDKIFINERNSKKSYTDFKEIVEWVWMDSDDLTSCNSNPDIIKDYLLDKNVSLRWISVKKKDKKKKSISSEISEVLIQEQENPQELNSDSSKIGKTIVQQEFVEDTELLEGASLTEESVIIRDDQNYKTETDLSSTEIRINKTSDQDQSVLKTPPSKSAGAFQGLDLADRDKDEEEDFDPECKPKEASITEIQIEDLDTEEPSDMLGITREELTEESIIDGESHELISEGGEEDFESSSDYKSKRNEFTPKFEPFETPTDEIDYIPGIKNHIITRKRKASHYRPRNPPKNTIDIGRWGEEYALFCLKDKKLKEFDVEEDSIIEIDQGFIIKTKGNELFKAVWVNKHKEAHEGYDIYFVENGETFFIEVKATTTDTLNWFDITPHEWSQLIQNKEHYYIYRVYNAGKSSARYLSIKNPYKLWKQEKIYVVASQIHL